MPTPQTLQYFDVYLQGVDLAYQSTLDKMSAWIDKQKAFGLTQDEILQRLTADANNGRGLFREFMGDVEKSFDDLGFAVWNTAANDFDSLTETAPRMYRWELDPTAEHCDSCLYQAKRGSLPRADWPTPSNQPTHGKTNCREYCKCTLVPVG